MIDVFLQVCVTIQWSDRLGQGLPHRRWKTAASGPMLL